MAVTFINPITVTVEKAIDYVKKDKESILDKDDVADAIDYAGRDKVDSEIIHKTITTALNCTVKSANDQWLKVREMYNKNSGNLAYHVWQSFEEKIDGNVANEIGVKLAKELFEKYQCVVSTHTNTEHTHNHIVFNAVSFLDGKKYDDCLKSYAELRKVSDKLCEEYELNVLEKTKDFNLVRYKDENGKYKYFEKTDRKDKVLQGEYSNANDYRNTEAYKQKEVKVQTNREVIKNDIDKVLPFSKSFDDMIDRLVEIGYDVKSKKKNGDYLMHIAYKEPTQKKYTRDHMIGEEYTRENLVIKIEENLKSISNKNIEKDNPQQQEVIKIYDDDIYRYGRIIIEEINENYRKKKNKRTGQYEKVDRSDVEKYIIFDTKKINKEIDMQYKKASSFKKFESKKDFNDKSVQYLMDRINGNLQTLKFVENKNLQSFAEINNTIILLYQKRDMVNLEFGKIRNGLKKANESISIINLYTNLKSSIEVNRNNEGYNDYEMQGDLSMLKKYEAALKQRNLLSNEEQNKFIDKFDKYGLAFNQLTKAMEKINEQISEYDKCVYNIQLVDRGNNKKYTEDIHTYYEIRNENRNTSTNNKNKER